MKILIPIISCYFFTITACHNNNSNDNYETTNDSTIKQQPVADTASQQYEMQLLNAVNKYQDSLILKENLIQYYRDNNQLDLAINTTNKFIVNDSLNAKLWHIKGVLLLENFDTTNAIAAFEKALSISPSPKDLIDLGAVYAYQKNMKAISISDNLIQLFKERYKKEALFIKGTYFSNLNNNVEALRYFDSCIAIDFSFMEAYREKAIVLMRLKKYYQAIALLNKATTLNNSFDEGYYYLGKCFESINDSSRSVESYQKALLYNADNTEAAEALQLLQKNKE